MWRGCVLPYETLLRSEGLRVQGLWSLRGDGWVSSIQPAITALSCFLVLNYNLKLAPELGCDLSSSHSFVRMSRLE